jgi:uncharacterized membrane protein YjfL (UPF0719 family)
MDAKSIAFVAIAVTLLLVLAKFVHRLLFGRSLTDLLIESDNRAVAVCLSGFMLGVVNVVMPVLGGSSHSFWVDIRGVTLYGLGAIVAMTLTRYVFGMYSRWTGMDLIGQVKEGNVAAGMILAAEYLAASYLVGGALTGDESGDLTPTIVFWLAGVVALIVITHLFRQLTEYDDVQEIKKGNAAAAAGYAGLLIANGMMVGHAVSGEFTGYASGFRGFGLMLLVILIFYPVRQFVVQTVLLGGRFSLRGGRIDHEIAEDQNIGAGLLEGVAYVATAMIVTHIS